MAIDKAKEVSDEEWQEALACWAYMMEILLRLKRSQGKFHSKSNREKPTPPPIIIDPELNVEIG